MKRASKPRQKKKSNHCGRENVEKVKGGLPENGRPCIMVMKPKSVMNPAEASHILGLNVLRSMWEP